MFNPSKKQLDHKLKVKRNCKKLYQTDSVKYLGIHIDKKAHWKIINNVAIKLGKVNATLNLKEDNM